VITLPDANPIDRSGFPSLDARPDRRDHAMQELITLSDAHPIGRSGFPSLDARPSPEGTLTQS